METIVSTELTESVFAEVARIWGETGVGNPARGDSFEAVKATLPHGGRFFTLFVGGVVAGACWVTNDGRRLYLHHMAVAPRFQGRGFSKPLLAAALDYGRELGLQMKLEVHSDNERARRLYEAHGFASLGDYEVLIRRDMGSR